MAIVKFADQPRGFNYADLDAEVVQFARDTAERFRDSQRRSVTDIFAIGADLLKVKEKLGYGRFTQWLKTEFPNDKRTAQRFMQVADRIPKIKSDIVSPLPPTLVYTLTAKSTPQDVIEEVIADLESGTTVEVVKATIDAARPCPVLRRHMQGARSRRRSQQDLDKSKKAHGAPGPESEHAKAAAQEIIEEFGLAAVRRVVDALDDYHSGSALRTLISETRSDDTAVSAEAVKAKLAALDGDLPVPDLLKRVLPTPII
jgi:hypothetical protein